MSLLNRAVPAALVGCGLLLCSQATAQDPSDDRLDLEEIRATPVGEPPPERPKERARKEPEPLPVGEPPLVTWDAKFGVLPDRAMWQAEAGFSAAIKAAYHVPLGESVSVGPGVLIDYSFFALPSRLGGSTAQRRLRGPGTVSAFVMAPLRFSLHRHERAVLGLRLDPGLGVSRPKGALDTSFALALHTQLNVGVHLGESFIAGAGLEAPVTVLFNDASVVAAPVLLGPMVEIHPVRNLAITADVKAGAWILGGNFRTLTEFGFQALLGVAYRP